MHHSEFLRIEIRPFLSIYSLNGGPAVAFFASLFTHGVVCIQPDVDTSSPQAVANPSVETAVVAQSSASAAAEELDSNGDMLNPDSSREEQVSGGKKVVRVVRRVVRRVIPAGTEPPSQPVVPEATKAAESGMKAARPGNMDKDDISMGLTSLMGRGRTKEHRPRTRTQDRKEEVKEEAKQEEADKVEEQEEEAEDEAKKPAEVTSANLPPAKSNPIAPPAPKPDPLAPPAGFIPAPKQSLLTPPPGFIPRRSSPVNPLARPPGFIPVTKTDPLAPPAGFIPKPRPVAVKKPEVLPSAKSLCLPLKL